MLDPDTKHRIDTARDILVGKVPDPKSQVEQITVALIYKFMDDMDAESEELGGKRKFFAGDFARYGWAKLMHSGLGGHEILNLYAEGIAKMAENPGIPPLFRNIFKNAYLPYRDPETLRAFLKIIDEFQYDHSERLGDAFEYLLSVLGSQGDAGQFRTPRHIIDFIVAVVDPQKSDVILDPACGTAGFLIAAYKHILKSNYELQITNDELKDKNEEKNSGVIRNSQFVINTLTPQERGRLAANIKGYDISPDMVRLSLVNLYLHGFADPHIHEYDTLTSQDKWNEYADVILANPPFMSPKGGIKPHNRFSVQSKRSEVLFVDYIAEHLTPTGRAGIIVPEGIIFQSQTAYKQLRKMLVENFLIAVISLPAGVFNPYSGVKTSILILDKALAKQTDHIAFFKVENDGFNLGAQRRPIEQNDLPAALEEITNYKLRITNQEKSPSVIRNSQFVIVSKEKIAANGDFNLSGERYRENEARTARFPYKYLKEICSVNPEQADPAALFDGWFNYIDISCVESKTGKFLGANRIDVREAPSRARRIVAKGDVLLSTVRPNLKAFTIMSEIPDRAIASTGFAVLRSNPDELIPQFLIQMVRDRHALDQMIGMMGKGAYPSINQIDVEAIKIPLPPLSVQQEIVAEIEIYQKVIDGARAVVDNYRPNIYIRPEWPVVALGDHFATTSGGTPSKAEPIFWIGEVPWVSPKDMKSDVIEDTEDHISEGAIAESATKLIPAGSVVCVVRSGILKHSFPIALLSRDMCINQDIIAFQPISSEISSKFLFYALKTKSGLIIEEGIKPGVTVQSFHSGFFKSYLIPFPSLETQHAIVAEIEAEQALVNANRELITRFEKKIKKVLERVWGNEDDE